MIDSQKVPPSLFERAFPILLVVPFIIQGKRIPMIWIDTAEHAELAPVLSRLRAVGEIKDCCISENQRVEAYGASFSHWIFADKMYPDNLFWHVALDAPAFVHHRGVSVSSLQAQFLIRCDLKQESTDLLLSAINESQRCFLQFDAPPQPRWIQDLGVPIDPVKVLGPRLSLLMRSSLPMYFNKDGFALVKHKFNAWQWKREIAGENQ